MSQKKDHVVIKEWELIFDSSPLQALRIISSIITWYATNPSTPWFTLRFKDQSMLIMKMKQSYG